MIIDTDYLKVDANGEITFLYSHWKLPSYEHAFDGCLEGKPTIAQEKEILNAIDERRRDWLEYGPQPQGWDQFSEVTQIVGKKLVIQIWDPIMFMLEDDGPYPFEAHCVGLNLALNNDGYMQSHMCLKGVYCPQDKDGFDGAGRLEKAPNGVFMLNLGDIYKISILKQTA